MTEKNIKVGTCFLPVTFLIARTRLSDNVYMYVRTYIMYTEMNRIIHSVHQGPELQCLLRVMEDLSIDILTCYIRC